ncbi:MAG: NAD(P)H-hydrate dehydratase [Candidatus Hydrogenedentes bacterium]|nr:NAD(P)H-hydrate dehydratase [Candidatus Hydrogenedentota bacterium]
MTETTLDMVRSLLPARPPESHKGTFGHVLILAGSRGFTGAARLAATAAGRSGAGLVTVGVPESLGDVVGAALLEAMSLPLPETEAESFSAAAVAPALASAAARQAVVLGPGISQHPETRQFVLDFVRQCPTPLLIDADGLNALSAAPEVLNEAAARVVVTPHPGEMARLCGQSVGEVQRARERTAAQFAERHGYVVVLKGQRSVIAAEDGICRVNPTGNAGLATGGTGDVLSGLIGGLMAQGMDAFNAAVLGVYVHGKAGDLAAERMTQRGMLAGDVLDAIPQAWRELEQGSGA